ncbi:MAG: hypothetical protein H0X33_12915 [Taibaiella sp.]|nr:hypothetical protein [Taibaiella sp.]
MTYPEITQDDLYDLGFEPLVTDNSKSIDYEHKASGIRLWKGMFNPDPASRSWKCGYGKEKIQFETLEELKAYMESKGVE